MTAHEIYLTIPFSLVWSWVSELESTKRKRKRGVQDVQEYAKMCRGCVKMCRGCAHLYLDKIG